MIVRGVAPARLLCLGLLPLSMAAAAQDAVRPVAEERPQLRAPVVPTLSLRQARGGTAGGESFVTTVVEGGVSGNQAVNVSSGQNVINGGAFAGMNGVPMVIQNSGSNVLIQSSTVVNVTVK